MTIQAKALVRLTGIILSLFLFTTIAAKAQAGEGDLGSTGRFDNNDKSVTIEKGGTYTITGTGVETGNTITVNLPSPTDVADITINNVKIGLKGCPFNIKQGVVKLTLEGDNVLKALGAYDDDTKAWCAALQVSGDSELVITEKSTGKLTATGGYLGAGIGGGERSHVGSITIAGGTVVATGGNGGAGIGGGSNSSAGSITIAGGTVEATGGVRGAGIGGGGNSSRDVSITISGGTVDATGGGAGAGIGGGFFSSGGTITISGGKVTTKGNIGAGEGSQSPAKGTISGGTIVCKSFTSDLTISGGSVRTEDNSVDKDGKVMAVVKGSPNELPANTKVTSITIGEETYNWKDVYTDKNGMLYLYLQQDQPGSATVTIDTKTYTANASREYDITKGPITITAAGDYTIVGGETQTGNTITVNLGKKEDVANITIEGVNISKAVTDFCPFNIMQGTVNLTLAGNDNKLQAGMPCAALQVSANSELLITKKSTGKLTATGGTSGAGIGGGAVSPVGSITIAGGTVVATGGARAADIGGGDGGTISFITIEGGTVMATGGYLGASIGGSNESDGIINISGGTVMANANIGNSENGRTVTGKISGGTIVCGSITSTFTISGGSVHSLVNNVMDDGKGMAVIKGLPANSKVKSITIDNDKSYGMNDVYTDGNGLLYLYIPKDKPVPLSLTMNDQEEYSASYVAASDKYLPGDPGANASLVQKTTGRNPVLFRNQNGGIIDMDGEWNDTPTVGSLVELKIKTNSVLNYNKLEGISEKDLNVKFTGKVDDTDKGEAEYILTYTISFNMPNQDVCISLFDKLLVEGNKNGYKVELNRLTITKPGEYTLKGAYAFLSDEEKKEINPSEIGVVFSVAVNDDIGNVTLHLDGVSLMSKTQSVPALSCGSGNTVTVVPDGDNYLEGGYKAAGINKGPDAGTLTIEGPGRLEVKGGSNAAGIGGNYKEQANNITIAGGTIVASGGGGVAGIGSGADVSTATGISITGGSVYATVPSLKDKKRTTAVTFPAMPGAKVINANVEDLGGYGLPGMNLYPKDSPSTATLYLWLPSGDTDKEITINGYSGKVTAGNSATLEAITIDRDMAYNPNTHKDKSIKIAPDVTFTINADNASVIDLTIKPGGKLLTEKQLEVKGRFTVELKAKDANWITFCSPVPLNLLYQRWATELNSSDLFLKSGFTTANDQKWTLEQSLKENTPYLIGVPTAVLGCTLYAQNVTIPKGEDISIDPPSGFDNNLLFRANTSLTEQELTNIYVLDDYNSKQAIVLKDNYTLKPFEAYFIASPASPTTPAIESQGEPGKVTSPELRAAPDDIIMPQKLTLKQPHSGKGSFTVEKKGQVAYGFALPGETVTLELKPNANYYISDDLIKVYETGKSTSTIQFNGSDNTRTFTMPNAPVTIEVEFRKELTINPDKGQVVYADEEIKNYHPTYTVEGITEADGNVNFTGNLGVVENKDVYTIDKGDLSAVNYTLDVKSDVTVTKLTDKKAADAVAKLDGSPVITNGWYSTNPVTLIAPSGFLIKQTSVSSASLSLRDAADADGYTDKLTFTEQGEHTVVYSLKRKATNKEYGGKSITYRLDYSNPDFEINVYKGKITMTLTDWASGLASYSYSWDGGKEQHADNLTNAPKKLDITLPGGAGSHTLSITLKDQAGNVKEVKDRKVTLEDTYVPDVPDDGEGGNGGSGEPDPDEPVNPDPDEPVANEAIQAPALGIYVENGKLCLEASQPCRVMICNYQGGAVMIRQIPSGKTRLYELPAGQYIVSLSAPYLPQGKVTQKVMVW